MCQLCTPRSLFNTPRAKRKRSPQPSVNSSTAENNCPYPARMANDNDDFKMWGSEIVKIFLEILVDEIKKEGPSMSKKDRSFFPRQWQTIDDEMTKKVGKNYGQKKLKGKFARLKANYKEFVALKNHTGLGWDPITQTVTAPDDVWENYVQHMSSSRPNGRQPNSMYNPYSDDDDDVMDLYMQRYWPWFKDCVGAIDGTYVVVVAPEDKYYLVDAGYTHMPGYVAPYRGQKYHLQEFNRWQESSDEDDVEDEDEDEDEGEGRGEGASQVHGEVGVQNVHENEDGVPAMQQHNHVNMSREQLVQMGQWRDEVAASMWEAYNNRVTPSVSCGRFDLRCTKIREERIHLGTPPFIEDALKTKQKAAHTPDSSSFAENDVEMDSEGFVMDAQELKLWPNRIELAFIQLMVEEVKQDPSLTKKNSFTTRHWTRIDDELYSQFRVRYTVNRLKQKYHRIRKTVMAPDDVWDHYVKAHLGAKVFRKKGLDHIDLLDILFANSQATGALAHASTQGPPTSDEERDIQSAFFGVGINSNTNSIPIDDDMDGDDDPKVGGSFDLKVGGSSGNDGGRKGAHFDFALDTWTATNLAKKEFFARQNKMAEASQAEKQQNSIVACIQCLATMDEITPDQYVKACESFRDKATRKMFMLMLPNMQLHWVRKLA
ncbi:unnamed protein product [Camellia sinensis]